MTWNLHSKAVKNSTFFYCRGGNEERLKGLISCLSKVFSPFENLITLISKIQRAPEKPEFLALVLPVPIQRSTFRNHLFGNFSKETFSLPYEKGSEAYLN